MVRAAFASILTHPVHDPLNTPLPQQPDKDESKQEESTNDDAFSMPDASSTQQTTLDAWESILACVKKEFSVLSPVLQGASLLERDDHLYLVLDQSYQFFEKKLSEPKFKEWFLDQYRQITGRTILHWCVTLDINHVPSVASAAPSQEASDNVSSKTVNQIVEMFEGHVLH